MIGLSLPLMLILLALSCLLKFKKWFGVAFFLLPLLELLGILRPPLLPSLAVCSLVEPFFSW